MYSQRYCNSSNNKSSNDRSAEVIDRVAAKELVFVVLYGFYIVKNQPSMDIVNGVSSVYCTRVCFCQEGERVKVRIVPVVEEQSVYTFRAV